MTFFEIVYLLSSLLLVATAVLPHTQHTLHHWLIRWMNQTVNTQMALAGLGFLSQKVAFKRFVPAYFTSSCYVKRLFST